MKTKKITTFILPNQDESQYRKQLSQQGKTILRTTHKVEPGVDKYYVQYFFKHGWSTYIAEPCYTEQEAQEIIDALVKSNPAKFIENF